MNMNASSLYDVYNQRREALIELGQKQLRVIEQLNMDAVQSGAKQGDIVRGLLARLSSDKLRVLIVGRFSAGKSTFINALIGQKLLPATPTPTTGVLCNIAYAEDEEKRVVLYPKPGSGPDGTDEPFDIPLDELERHIKIDHFDGSEVTSRYKRMDLFWPLELCQNGVEIIDSVGLDDPDSRDDITLDYAQSVDAILYLMKSQDTNSRKDLDTIQLLRSLGYESLFFIITYYDHIKESAEFGETSEEDFQNFVKKNLLSLTNLGINGIKFVDSKSALLGRIKDQKERVEESGILDVEQSLEAFLVEERGKAKIITTLRSLYSVNKAVRPIIISRIDMLQTSQEELERRYEEAKIPLKILEGKKQYIVGKITAGFSDVLRESRDMASSYFQQLPDKISSWTDAYQPETKVELPSPKSTLKSLVKEIANHLKFKIESDVSEWAKDTLFPMVEKRIEEIQDDLEKEAKDFVRQVDHLRLSISIGEHLKDEDLSVWDRLLSGGYMLMTGDFVTGAMGLVMGGKAMLTTLGIQIVAAIVLAVFGLSNPVAIGLAVIGSILGGGFLNLRMLNKEVKKNVKKRLTDELNSRKSDLAERVENQVREKLMNLKNGIEQGLARELSSVQDEVENILAERKKGTMDAQAEIKKLRQLEEQNLEIDSQLDELMCETGLS